MARGIFHKPVRWRPKGSKFCFEVGASSRIQIVKRAILEHAVSIGAAIELPANYSPRNHKGATSDGTGPN
jgi:hypothetical protein